MKKSGLSKMKQAFVMLCFSGLAFKSQAQDLSVGHIMLTQQNVAGGQSFVFQSAGNGSFHKKQISKTYSGTPGSWDAAQGWAYGKSSVKDATGDGLVDICNAEWDGGSSSRIRIYAGLGDGTFSNTPIISVINASPQNWLGDDGTRATLFADANGDGAADCIVVGSGSSPVAAVYLNNGTGTFSATRVNTTLTSGSPSNECSGFGSDEWSEARDVNNDGFADWILTSRPNQKIYVWRGTGTGTFNATPVVSNIPIDNTNYPWTATGYNNYASTMFGDVNNDGNVDYVYADEYLNSGNGAYILAFLGSGTGSFNSSPVYTSIPVGSLQSWAGTESQEDTWLANMDGDSFLDLVHVNEYYKKITVFKGLGNGHFATTPMSTLNGNSGNCTSLNFEAGMNSSNVFYMGSGVFSQAYLDTMNVNYCPIIVSGCACQGVVTFTSCAGMSVSPQNYTYGTASTGIIAAPIAVNSLTTDSTSVRFTVSGTNFNTITYVKVIAGMTSVSIPVNYDGAGVFGSRTLTITTQGNAYSTCTVTVNVSTNCYASTTAPTLSSTTFSNTCPIPTVNLNTIHSGTIPTNTTLVWFTNNTHTGSAYATPTLATAGTYYAFYFDAANNCYSPVSSALTVTTTPCCNAGSTAPTVH